MRCHDFTVPLTLLEFRSNQEREAALSRICNVDVRDASGAKISCKRARSQLQRDRNAALIKAGTTFEEFTQKSWVLPEEYYPNRYSVMVHGIGLCDEWPAIRYPTDGGDRNGIFEKNMTITVESYIGKLGGKEGVKLEQQYIVKENGLELMSKHPLEEV